MKLLKDANVDTEQIQKVIPLRGAVGHLRSSLFICDGMNPTLGTTPVVDGIIFICQPLWASSPIIFAIFVRDVGNNTHGIAC